jgi:hypothetical protein
LHVQDPFSELRRSAVAWDSAKKKATGRARWPVCRDGGV